MSEKQNISCRYSARARGRLELYCELSGMKSSEVIKAAIAQFIAPTLAGYERSAPALQNDPPHVRECSDIELTKVNSSCTTNENIQPFFKSFWFVVENKQFPKRVIKTIKDCWEDLKELDPRELGEMYNNYCTAQELQGREYRHPNSWIIDGGYENQDKEESGGINYDIEG